jgi:hypothetical protein
MFGSFVEPLDDPLSGRQLRLRLPLGGRDRSAKGVVLMPVVTPVDGTPDRKWIEHRLGDWSTSFDADPINR